MKQNESYTAPEAKEYTIAPARVICGSGKDNETIGSGDPDNPPTPTPGGIIFGD